jgi:1-acyl-sn-glycerol-3-phosphate acyltransferase
LLRSFIRSTLKLLFALLTRLEVEGQENIPRQGAALLVHNHLSRLDAPLVFTLLPRDDATWLVAHTYRKVPVLNWFVDSIQGIWINREAVDFRALKQALEYLQGGGLLGIAPEGYISHSGGLKEGKTGAAYLVDRADVPVIPLAIAGIDRTFHELARLRRASIQVRVGEPFRLPPVERSERSAALQRNTDEIMMRIAALLPEGYRGVYA